MPAMLQSAPPSPSAFHLYASRRQSNSALSPRFLPQVSGGSAPRSKPASATVSQSPVLAFTQSPPVKKKEYKDASTQYSPPGFPPTHHRPRLESTAPPALGAPQTTTITDPDEGPIAEPPEPELRIDPQPVSPWHSNRPARKAAPENEGQDGQQDGQQGGQHGEASHASQEPLSPAKRARPQEPSVKVMPLKYETCDVKDLGVLISDMLMELVRLNDGFPLHDGQLTRFHSRAPPGISVRDYLNRLIVHATLSPPILLSMVFYVDKLCTMYSAFTISSLTVHRFLITAATVAAKGLSDSFWTNSLYARVGGVSVRELALLELEFLRRLEWRIVPKPETLVDYYKGLVERGQGYEMEKEENTQESRVSSQDQQQTANSTTGSDVIHAAHSEPGEQ